MKDAVYQGLIAAVAALLLYAGWLGTRLALRRVLKRDVSDRVAFVVFFVTLVGLSMIMVLMDCRVTGRC